MYRYLQLEKPSFEKKCGVVKTTHNTRITYVGAKKARTLLDRDMLIFIASCKYWATVYILKFDSMGHSLECGFSVAAY